MERNNLAHAVNLVGWGYFFLYINVTLGTINILPVWVAYILIGKAIDMLKEGTPSLALLRPLGILLGIWEGVLWVANLVGVSPDHYFFEGIQLVMCVLELYFHFQLLTDLAELARRAQLPDEKNLLRLRTVRTVLATATAIFIQRAGSVYLAVGVAMVGAIVGIWICIVLFGFQKRLAQTAEDPKPRETA